jgi:hypothetical protein
MQPQHLNLFGLEIRGQRSATISFGVLTIVLAIVARVMFPTMTGLDMLVAGLLASAIHWLSIYLHHFGHYLASLRVNHPMIGIQLYYVLGRSLYPPNERPLSAMTHIRRAIGGPLLSLGVAIVFLVLWNVFSFSSVFSFVFWFGFFTNLFVFALGALIPLPFSDGGTILHYWSKRNQEIVKK